MTRKKTNAMQKLRRLVGLWIILAMASPAAQARVLVDETFENLSPNVGSNLTGLDGWATFLDKSGEVATGTGANTSTVVTTPAASTNNTGNRNAGTNFDLVNSEIAVLEFDAYVPVVGSAATAMFSIGNNGSNPGPMVGIQFGAFAVRGDNFGTITNAKTTSNTNVAPVADTWYRVRSEWHLASGTATLFVQDLSGNDANVTDTGFQQLFFDSTRATSSATLDALSNLANWNEGRIRLGGNGGTGSVDNLHATAAQVLANYAFGSTTPLDLTSSGHVAASSPGSVAFGPGVNGNITSGSANGNPTRSVFLNGISMDAANEADAVTANDYITFDVSPSTGFELSFTELSFDFQRDVLEAPSNWSLRADAAGDNFATQIAAGVFTSTVGLSGNTGANFFRYTIDLSNVAFLQDLTTAATFRLYLWGAASTDPESTNKARIDNIIVYGQSAATAVPEPASAMLMFGGLAIAMLRRRR